MTSMFEDASALPAATTPRVRPNAPPHLLTWDAIPSTSSSPSSSPASSPVMSPSSQAFDDVYSPQSKSLWQLSQSEPAISVDNGEPDGGLSISFGETQSPQKVAAGNNVRRRNTLQVNIPTKVIGHTRSLSDEDPVLTLAESSFDTENVWASDETGIVQTGSDGDDPDVIMMDEVDVPRRGRSITAGATEIRLGTSLPPSPRKRSRQGTPLLKLPLHIACQASTDAACPNGASCPYAHTHVNLRPKPQRPSRTREILALSEQFNAVARSLTSQAPVVPAGTTSPPPPQRGTYISSGQPIDVLGMPPNPLVRPMDISQYSRSSRRKGGRSRAGSVASDGSKESTGKHSRRGSSTKFTLPAIPPFKGTSRRGSDASAADISNIDPREAQDEQVVQISKRPSTLLDDLLVAPPVRSQPLSNVLPQTLYDSSVKAPPEHSMPSAQAQLHSPPMSPPQEPHFADSRVNLQSKAGNAGRSTKRGPLFANAVADLRAGSKSQGSETSTIAQTTVSFTKQQSMFGKPMFSLPMSSRNAPFTTGVSTDPESHDSRRMSHSSKSSRSSNQHDPAASKDPASPTYTSHTTESNSTERTQSATFNQPSFTNPTRPLFSGYDRVVPADLDVKHVDENVRKGAEEWLQRQREKDLRQALRLEKALEEKRLGLIRKLEWQPPVVETTKGYGYGDGLEVKKEVTMPNGEVFRALEWEERLGLEREVKKVEVTLVKVREDIVKNGGTAGQPISYKGNSSTVPSKDSNGTVESGDVTNRPAKDKGKGRQVVEYQDAMPTPQTPEHVARAEMESTQTFNRMRTSNGGIDLINAYAANASPSELLRLAQRVPEVIQLPQLPIPVSRHPELLRAPPSTTIPSRPHVGHQQPPPVVKRASVTLDEHASKQAKSEAPRFSLGKPLLDLFATRSLPSGKTEQLTEQSMKRHQDMLAAAEKKEARDLGLVSTLSPPKADNKPNEPQSPETAYAALRQPGRSMWAKWGDSPLPGTTGAAEDLGSPPFTFVKPRPASSVPPPGILSRPSSVLPVTIQQSSVTDPVAEKQTRRVSMSTAKPGEETSVQTMEEFDFNNHDSDDDDNDADDSREYLSAEEGPDAHSDEEDNAPESKELSNAPTAGPSSSGHPLQRKRSSTLTGIPIQAPVPEKQHRPSPLDDWTFDFASRRVVSPGPFSSAASTSGASIFGGRATPTRHHHHSSTHGVRRSSQESNPFPQLFGYGVAAPNNTPDSPPPHRYEPASPTAARSLPAERFTISSFAPQSSQADINPQQQSHATDESAGEDHAHQEPFFIVNRSSNVLDEAANLIEYSTARVMSGGVKIGSILPRGVNGVIEEEDEGVEDLEVEFETTAPAVPLPLPTVSLTTSPAPLETHLAMASYPLGVPVPGHPQAVSGGPSTPLGTLPSMIPQQHPLGHLPIGQVQGTHLHKRPSLALASHGPHNAHLSLPSPVTSTSGSQSISTAPVEYCGDFRTTGHCRFGARCRYSHDIEPRVRTSTSNTASRYRPSISSVGSDAHPISPRTKAVGIPPVPAGYQLSNVLPQPHHIPGIPASQQPLSPFLFAHPSTVAHPLTSVAATAAANQGVTMANTEKAAKILKSLGITPQQLLALQPAPTVMADGEIMYDLTKGRSTEGGVLLAQDSAVPFPRAAKMDHTMKEARDMVLMRFGTEEEKRAVMGSSAGMVMDGEEEDIWTVSQGRQSHLPNQPGPSGEGQRRRVSRAVAHEQGTMKRQNQNHGQYQTVEQDKRHALQARGSAGYTPVQHPQYPNGIQLPVSSQAPYPHHQASASHYHHPMPLTSPGPSATPMTTPSPVSAAGGSLTQDEVIKVLTALGLSVPGLTTMLGHPSSIPTVSHTYSPVQPPPRSGSQSGQNPQHPRYPPGPYDHMHPSMHQ